jgi:DNA-binding GntR family transcriptional regulator
MSRSGLKEAQAVDAGNDGAREGVAYQKLAQTLREAISRGDFADGKRLPTEIELSTAHALSRQTVRRALQELVSEGLVYRVRGRGTFATGVSPGNRYLRSFGSVEDLLAYSLDTTMETVEPLTRRAEVDTASRLRLDSDDVMVALARRAHSEVPFCVTRLAFSVETGTKLREEGVLDRAGQVSSLTAISVVDRVASAIAGAHQSVTVVALPPELATLVEVEPGSSVLRIDRLYYDTRSQPIELAVSYFNPGRYTYRVELSRGPRPH